MDITTIADLRPDNTGTIKVCTINKSQTRYQYEGGTRFSIKLFDNSGKIFCDFFCKDNPPQIEEGRVYLLSNYSLKLINEPTIPSSEPVDYKTKEMYKIVINDKENENFSMKECLNEIPLRMQFNYYPLNQLKRQEIDNFVDVLGVVVQVNDEEHINGTIVAQFGEVRLKRNIFITDNSLQNNKVRVTLWGEKVEDFDFSTNTILAIKDARVTKYEGEPELTIGLTSVIDYDPDLSEQQEFSQWYDSKDVNN